MSAESLYRREAVENKSQSLYGDVTIPKHMSFNVFFYLVIFSLVALLIFLSLYKFSDSIEAPGILTPSLGQIKIKAPRQGIIARFLVEEGDRVEAGQALAEVKSWTFDRHGKLSQSQSLESIEKQIELIKQGITIENKDLQKRLALLKIEQSETLANKKHLEQQLVVQNEILAFSLETFQNLKTVAKNGFVSKTQLNASRRDYLEATQSIDNINNQLNSLENKSLALVEDLERAELAYRQSQSDASIQIERLKQFRAELQSNEEHLVLAPVSGTISAILGSVGQNVTNADTIVDILPDGSALVAEMFVESRGIPFVHPGQKVNISYDAFPESQFGAFPAEIASVTRTILLPSEVRNGLNLDTASYRITAKIDPERAVEANGHPIQFRPGMRFTAKVLLSETTALSWLFSPETRKQKT